MYFLLHFGPPNHALIFWNQINDNLKITNDHTSNAYTLSIKTNIVKISIETFDDDFLCTSCIYSNSRMCTIFWGIFFLLQPLTNFVPLRF